MFQKKEWGLNLSPVLASLGLDWTISRLLESDASAGSDKKSLKQSKESSEARKII